MTRARAVIAAGLVVLGLAAPAAAGADRSSSADPVVEWARISHDTAVTAMASGGSPTISVFSYPIAQAAVYDAAVAIDERFEPYAVKIDADPDASQAAAVATAAHRVLVAIFPAQASRLDRTYAGYLVRLADGKRKRAGVRVGKRAAAGILRLREGDGREHDPPFMQRPRGPGVYEPEPPGFNLGVGFGQVRPFGLKRGAQFRPGPPSPLTSAQYAADFEEVKQLGRIDSATRADPQTAVARFWFDDPFVVWVKGLARIARHGGLDLTDAARLHALGHVAIADSIIACWDAKYHYHHWRPRHAVQRADTDGVPATVGDPSWEPLEPTHPHPEYPSGYNCLTGALAKVIAHLQGREARFALTSETTKATRTFTAKTLAKDVIDARVWAGAHFRNSDDVASKLGRRVARWIIRRHFRPDD